MAHNLKGKYQGRPTPPSVSLGVLQFSAKTAEYSAFLFSHYFKVLCHSSVCGTWHPCLTKLHVFIKKQNKTNPKEVNDLEVNIRHICYLFLMCLILHFIVT